MHHKYHTEAIILSGYDLKESNKYLTVLTKELGLIRAVAQGVREARSKLRYGLQEYSLSDISLVKGREVWRLTNASPIDNYYYVFKDSPEKLDTVSRIADFIKRFIQGEERDDRIFETLHSGFNFLASRNDFSVKYFETVMVLKLLSILGHMKEEDSFRDLRNAPWEQAVLISEKQNSRLIRLINESISSSNL